MPSFLCKSRDSIKTKLSKLRSPFTRTTLRHLGDTLESDRSRYASTDCILHDMVREESSGHDSSSNFILDQARTQEEVRPRVNASKVKSTPDRSTSMCYLSKVGTVSTPYGQSQATSLSSLHPRLSDNSSNKFKSQSNTNEDTTKNKTRLSHSYHSKSFSNQGPLHSTPRIHRSSIRTHPMLPNHRNQTLNTYFSSSALSTGSHYSRDQRRSMAKKIQKMKKQILTEDSIINTIALV